jgi:dienelactone hydrolase
MDELRVLPERDPSSRAASPLYIHLQRRADAAIERRLAAYEQVKTAEDAWAWQRARREMFLAALGDFPQRTPLNAKITGTISGDGYRIENVLLESRPGHHVTGNLYLPLSKPPFPGVIVPCGHSFQGKAAESYQRVCMLLARSGIAAFCYDPIGQGERYQTFAPDGTPLGAGYTGSPRSVQQLEAIPGRPRFSPTDEHTLMGIGAILVGTNTAQYRIYDGMRAIDYLLSRDDIDPQRIGCTGNSGGGTLTAYLMALDERIACAAPVCYLTTFRRLLATSGPQDAEQNLFGQLAQGLDEADYVLMRAPKPTLLGAGTRDTTFDIAGTWEIYREGKRFYARLGFPERIDLCEADEPHGFTMPLRVAVVRWMRRWLLHIDDAITEPELPVRPASALQCTPQGQVMWLAGERSVFDLNRQREAALAPQRAAFWKATAREPALAAVRRLTRIRQRDELPIPRRQGVAVLARPGCRVEKTLLEVESTLVLPALDFRPEAWNGRVVLYLHASGKHVDAAPGGPIERLVQEGVRVLAVDLPGLGELDVRHPRDWGDEGRRLFGPNTSEFFLAYLLGESLVSLHTECILAVIRSVESEAQGDAKTAVEIVAVGTAAGIPALHAAALEPTAVAHLTLRRCLDSWVRVLDAPTAGHQLPHIVHAALTLYDLPDLVRTLDPSRFRQEEPVNALDQPIH